MPTFYENWNNLVANGTIVQYDRDVHGVPDFIPLPSSAMYSNKPVTEAMSMAQYFNIFSLLFGGNGAPAFRGGGDVYVGMHSSHVNITGGLTTATILDSSDPMGKVRWRYDEDLVDYTCFIRLAQGDVVNIGGSHNQNLYLNGSLILGYDPGYIFPSPNDVIFGMYFEQQNIYDTKKLTSPYPHIADHFTAAYRRSAYIAGGTAMRVTVEFLTKNLTTYADV